MTAADSRRRRHPPPRIRPPPECLSGGAQALAPPAVRGRSLPAPEARALPCSAWTRWQRTRSTPRSITALPRSPWPAAAASALLRSGYGSGGGGLRLAPVARARQTPAARSPRRRRTGGSHLGAAGAAATAASSQRAIEGAAQLAHPPVEGPAPARHFLRARGCPGRRRGKGQRGEERQVASSRQRRRLTAAAGVEAAARRCRAPTWIRPPPGPSRLPSSCGHRGRPLAGRLQGAPSPPSRAWRLALGLVLGLQRRKGASSTKKSRSNQHPPPLSRPSEMQRWRRS